MSRLSGRSGCFTTSARGGATLGSTNVASAFSSARSAASKINKVPRGLACLLVAPQRHTQPAKKKNANVAMAVSADTALAQSHFRSVPSTLNRISIRVTRLRVDPGSYRRGLYCDEGCSHAAAGRAGATKDMNPGVVSVVSPTFILSRP